MKNFRAKLALGAPERDPESRYSHPLVHCIAGGIRGRAGSAA